MGVDYTAILAIGKEFDELSEVVEFLEENNVLSEANLKVLEEEGDGYIIEVLYDEVGMPECSCLNCYSGYGYYLGYNISCRSVEEFEKTLNAGLRMWAEKFPNEPAEIIHTVRVS